MTATKNIVTKLWSLCHVLRDDGVKTNVIFFTRGRTQKGRADAVWVYDVRAGAPSYGKIRPLRADDFAAFETAFGTDPLGHAARQDEGEEGRFRRFGREDVAKRGDNLDIAWLRDGEDEAEDELTDPDDIVAAILGHLREATREVEALAVEIEGVNDTADLAVAAAE